MKRRIKRRKALLIYFIIFLFMHQAVHAQAFPQSFITFQDSVYMQNTTLIETMRLYTAAKQDIERQFAGTDMYLALVRCEYLMGLSFRAEGRNNEAAAYFEQGIALAENSIEMRPTSEGYRLLGTAIAFLCEVKRSYGIGNISKIEENAGKALELNPGNLQAKYLIAARYITAPWPFSDLRKGAALLDEIMAQNYLALDKEDLFNLYLMHEALCLKQKKTGEARVWHERGAALYPGNTFIRLLA